MQDIYDPNHFNPATMVIPMEDWPEDRGDLSEFPPDIAARYEQYLSWDSRYPVSAIDQEPCGSARVLRQQHNTLHDEFHSALVNMVSGVGDPVELAWEVQKLQRLLDDDHGFGCP